MLRAASNRHSRHPASKWRHCNFMTSSAQSGWSCGMRTTSRRRGRRPAGPRRGCVCPPSNRSGPLLLPRPTERPGQPHVSWQDRPNMRLLSAAAGSNAISLKRAYRWEDARHLRLRGRPGGQQGTGHSACRW
jgi:hypothetical protein